MTGRRPQPKAPPHQEAVLDISHMAPGGACVARDAAGVVLVDGAIAGERVRAAITTGKIRRGRVLEVLQPSPHRVAPTCQHHPRCGGCDLLHVDGAGQAAAKVAALTDALVRVGRFSAAEVARWLLPLDTPAPDAPRTLFGRRRATFRTDAQGRLTFSSLRSHDSVAIRHCEALHPVLGAAVQALAPVALLPGCVVQLAVDDRSRVVASTPAKNAARLWASGAVAGAISRDGATAQVLGEPELRGEVAPDVAGGPFVSDASVFAQASRFGASTILRHALAAVDAMPGMHVVELFSGSGHLTLGLLAAGARVTAYEGDAVATSFLRHNATQQGTAAALQTHVGFIDERVQLPPHDVLLADPPRTGAPGLDALVAQHRPKRVVLVSCDLATGARDLSRLVAVGYELVWMRPIDAFVSTSHVETVALLRHPTPHAGL